MRHYEYDLEDVDFDNDDDIAFLPPVSVKSLPVLIGLLEPLEWRTRHISDASYETGKALLDYIEREIFMWNETYISKLDEIIVALNGLEPLLSNLECICTMAASGLPAQYTTAYNDIVQELADNEDVNTDVPELGIELPETETYNAEKCQRMQAAFDTLLMLALYLIDFQTSFSGLSATAIVAFLAPLMVVSLPVALIAGVIVGLAAVILGASFSLPVQAFRDDERQAVVCLMYFAETSSLAAAAAREYINSLVYLTGTIKTLLCVLFSDALIGFVYTNNNTYSSKSPGYCAGCGLPEGCVNFCDSEWTLAPFATLQTDCSIIVDGATGQLAATRDFSVAGAVTLVVDVYNPFDGFPPGGIKVKQNEVYLVQWLENLPVGRQIVEIEIPSEVGTITVEFYAISGHLARWYTVCIEE